MNFSTSNGTIGTMPRLTYYAKNFPASYGALLSGTNSLNFGWPELLWAAISVGRGELLHLLRHGAFSEFEMAYRAAILFANLRETGSGDLERSAAYRGLDPSEKGAISYFMGLTVAKLFADRLLNVPWLMHLDVYRKKLSPIHGAAKPDLVFFTGYYPESGLLLKQKKQMGFNVPFVGGDAQNNPDLVKIAGKDAATGFKFLSPPIPKDLDTADSRAFLASYKQKYNEEPGSIWAVLAGDGFQVVTKAIAETKSTSADKIREYFVSGMKDFPGLTGKISFNAKGDRVGDLYRVYAVDKDGAFVLQK